MLERITRTLIAPLALVGVMAAGRAGSCAEASPPELNAGNNPFYVNDDGFLFLNYGTNRVMDPAHIEASRNAPECQPVEMDLAGNWGFPNDGRQFSIRFEKPEYARSDPINVHLIVRNLSDTNVDYYFFGAPDPLFQFVVTDARGQEIETRQDRQTTDNFAKRLSKTVISNPKLVSVAPGTQRKHTLEFHRFYDLEPGIYFISAWVRYLDYGDLYRRPEIRTANAILRITDSKSVSAGTKEIAAGGTRTSANTQISPVLDPVRSGRISAEMKGTVATAKPVESTADMPHNGSQSDSLPSRNESGGTRPGVAFGTVRIGASVLVTLLSAAVAFIVFHRTRRQS